MDIESSVPNGHSASNKRPRRLRTGSLDLRAGLDLDLPKTPATLDVKLNDQEKEMFRILVAVSDHLKAENPEMPPVVLRVAGGWVRDKLLGMDSHDIDIAIDTMKGYDFAVHVNAFLEKSGYEAHVIAKIALNPDKSKHLETATVKIFDHFVDFVNLRSETYTEHSRVPVIDHATPEEDAMRRDTTINAMFYNLHTCQVEDLTGHGLADLAEGRIRTPLPAVQTFLDDPLRVLRVVRFASRLNYKLDEDIPEAIHDENIRKALKVKISRERIGEEIRKMLRSKHPLRAIRYFHDLNLYPLLFVPPPNVPDPSPEPGLLASEYLYTFLSGHFTLPEHLEKIRKAVAETEKAHLFLAADLLPFREATYLEKKKQVPVARYICLEELKLSNAEAEVCCALLGGIQSAETVVESVAGGSEDRTAIGLLIRELGARPLLNHWRNAVLMAMVAEVVRIHPEGEDSFDFTVPVLQMYEQFFATVEKLHVGDAWELKPILDGNQVLSTLQMKPGPQLRPMLDDLVKWQLKNPNSGVEDARSWLVETFGNK